MDICGVDRSQKLGLEECLGVWQLHVGLEGILIGKMLQKNKLCVVGNGLKKGELNATWLFARSGFKNL